MTQKPRPATKQEIVAIKKTLDDARARYDNKVLDIERIWAKLKPGEYKKRKLMTGLTKDLLDIDNELKMWEQKLLD